GAAGHVRHDVREDEQEQQRVHADTDGKRPDLTAQNIQVTHHQAEEGARIAHPPAHCRGRCRHRTHRAIHQSMPRFVQVSVCVYSRSSLPVILMKTVSSVGSVVARSRTPKPAEALTMRSMIPSSERARTRTPSAVDSTPV